MEERKFNRLRYGVIASCVFFGSASTILLNLLLERYSYYPLFMTIVMFTGEFLASFFLLSSILKSSNPKSNQSSFLNQEKRPKFFSISGKSIYSLVALFDLIGTWIENYSLQYMSPTDFLSLKMVGICYLVSYRVLVQKRKIYKHQYLGFAIFSVGIMVLVIENIIVSSKHERRSYGFYIGLILIAQLLTNFELIFLEYFTWKNDASSFEVNSIKGISGLVVCGIAYYPLSLICENNHETYSLIEPINKIFSGKTGPVILIILIFVLCFYNISLVQYVKMTEALSFKCIDSGRIITVSVILSVLNFKNLQGSIAIQAVSVVFVFTGLIIYNEILILPFCGLNKSAKLSISENKILKQKRAEQRTWFHKLDELVDIQNKTRELNNF